MIHDSKIKDRVFNVGDQVLLFNSCLKIFSGKLKTHWTGPFTIAHVFPYGTIELSQADGPNFKVNGHRLKHYFGGDIPQLVVSDLQTFPMDQRIRGRVKLATRLTKTVALRQSLANHAWKIINGQDDVLGEQSRMESYDLKSEERPRGLEVS
uniref:Reverse transcriptase domain-containing protein n=1 Tax=Tanacetum cinerariifolium TaxID=118510 RepID=A0A6L2K708_TANCI|nr:reverse transcriptase domain-containing protein [Tanacetum cinerariifolium]